MAELALQDLEKRYDNDTLAVKGISFAAEDGEFIVLVGPSGCGKSTTLRMIAGLEEITGGDLLIDGKRVNDLEPKDRDIAMVFQNYALYPHMTVYDNMAFPLKMRKVPKPEIKTSVEQAAHLLSIDHLLQRKPKELSGGERQRVAVGRAIVRKPKVFLFDEPLSNLDAALRTQMRAELKRLQRRLGATMVYVTHDQVEAMTMGDKIAVMNNGLMEQFGTPKEVYERPNSAFVARFLGSPPMNLIEGRVENGAFRAERLTVALPPGLEVTGEPVLLGFRPEKAVIGSAIVEHGIPFVEGKLILVELVGGVTHYYLEAPLAAGDTLVASISGSPAGLETDPKLGDAFRIGIIEASIHLFYKASGKRVF